MKRILPIIPFLLLSAFDLRSQCATPNGDGTTYGAGNLPMGAPLYGNEVNISTGICAGSFILVDKIVPGTSYTALINVPASGMQVYQGSTQIGSGSTDVSFTPSSNTPIKIYVCGMEDVFTNCQFSRNVSMRGGGSPATVADLRGSGTAIVYPKSPYLSSNPVIPSFTANTTEATYTAPSSGTWCGASSFNSRRDVWHRFTLSGSASRSITFRHSNIIPTERALVADSPISILGIAIYSSGLNSPVYSCSLIPASGIGAISTNLSPGTYDIRVFGNLGDGNTAAQRNSFQSDFYILDPNLILPVELTSFKAQQKNNQNHLSWQTATEKNNSHFDIERSAIGQEDWVKIGTVKGNGNSQIIRDYTFTDNTPLSISYYRLKQVDNDGGFDYSNIVNVTNKSGKFKINALLPNPTKDNLTIQFEANKNEAVNVTVLDMTGRIVLTQNASATEGGNLLNVNTASLSNGIYMVSLKNSESVIVNKIVKN
jgi:hypothetical protein